MENWNKTHHSLQNIIELFIVSFKLGCTSFGGPVAHLGYFHEAYVQQKKWLDEKSYADLVALSQFLPGPASSQVGIGIGIIRAGWMGGIVSFIGFTMPSAIVLILFALSVHAFDISNAGWIHGLKIVAVAIVAHAIIGMAKKLTPDYTRKIIAFIVACIILLFPSSVTQIIVILLTGLIGLWLFSKEPIKQQKARAFPINRLTAIICLLLFFGLLILLPIISELTMNKWMIMFDRFYRSGALVFGGGHVVLPLLEQAFVATDWISQTEFLAGYGATQAVPGPLFTFAAYLGTIMFGWPGGFVAIIAIFLPAFLLIIGALPFWNQLRHHPKMNGAMKGINAAVVGILIAAFFHPIWTSTIFSIFDFFIAVLLFLLLTYYRVPAWAVVIIGAVLGMLRTFL